MTSSSIYIKSESNYRSNRIRESVSISRSRRARLPFVRRPAEKSEFGN